MFTGITEAIGRVIERVEDGSNVHFIVQSSISRQFKIDNSVMHDGVCLTVTDVKNDTHRVTAVDETLKRTCLGGWNTGTEVNLERSLLFNGRVEGHLVQGHVDATATCISVDEAGGSHVFTFELPSPTRLLVHKGSVCVNGVSLTVVEPSDDTFSVAIIPFTLQHTNFKNLKAGHNVNIEFDIIGKYLERFAQAGSVINGPEARH